MPQMNQTRPNSPTATSYTLSRLPLRPFRAAALVLGVCFLAHGSWSLAEEAVLQTETFTFDELEAGELGDDFFVIDGNFSLVEAGEAEGKFVRAAGEPLVDSGLLIGGASNGPASIRAKIRSHSRGRSFPRAGVGLHGLGGHQLRLVPARREIEFAINDETVLAAPLKFESGAWYWLELRVEGSEEKGWTVSGYVWLDGEEKPGEPQLKRELESLRVTGRASLWATPYSGREIDFDEVTVKRTAPEGE